MGSPVTVSGTARSAQSIPLRTAIRRRSCRASSCAVTSSPVAMIPDARPAVVRISRWQRTCRTLPPGWITRKPISSGRIRSHAVRTARRTRSTSAGCTSRSSVSGVRWSVPGACPKIIAISSDQHSRPGPGRPPAPAVQVTVPCLADRAARETLVASSTSSVSGS